MNVAAGFEARRSRRHPVNGNPAVFDMMSERMLGRAVDLSAGGLKLLLAAPLAVDTLYQVKFELPMADGSRHDVVAGIQVLDPRTESGLMCAGARFIHLEGAGARKIVQWLRMKEADPAR